nr:mycofactocin radical SAM maturase [uncultured Desulfobacter sp.]
MSNRYVEQGLTAPVNLTWEVTQRCNLRCKHCLSASGRPAENELSTQEAFDLVDQLSAASVFQINFGGGEPFIRPDFYKILAKCHEKNIMTCISTNGLLLDEKSVGQLAQNHEMVAVQVSIDGASPATCDAIRGSGTFEAALEAVKLLAATPIATSINTVLTAQNADEIPALHALAESMGVSFRASRFRPSGRGIENWEALRPTARQLVAFSQWLADSPGVRTGDSFFSLTPQERQGLGLNLCGAAKLTCCVGPTGDIFPCAFLQSDPFYAGSLRKSSFLDIWDNADIFHSFRGLRIHSCEDCKRFDQCHGGCPAVAYHLKNEIDGGDPECLERCVSSIADATPGV